MPILAKSRQRKVAQWALAYLAGAWVLLQVADLVGDRFGWPDVWLRMLIVVLVVGFFAALILAWYHGAEGRQKASGIELGMLTALLVLAGVGVVWVRGSSGLAGGAGGAPTSAAATAGAGGAMTEQESIAVLPFADMSQGGDQEYFSDGLTEELLNVLSQLPELRVASRTSAFAFKGKGVGVDSIARALNVRHVLEGSVRKAGSQVRITAQLIDASTGYHLWSDTYDRELRDVFAIQDEISRAIVEALEVELGGDRAAGELARTQTRDPEAHTLLLRGLHFSEQGSTEGLDQAIALIRQAIGRDSSYARAWAELADVVFYKAYQIPESRGTLVGEAKAAAERALVLDPRLAAAHSALGSIEWVFGGDLPVAESHFRRAIELNPGLANAHSRLGWVLIQLGRTDEAIAASRRAVELDPVSGGMASNLGAMYVYADQPRRAIDAFESAVELNPASGTTRANLALSRIEAGDSAGAVADAERAADDDPGAQFTISTLAYVYGMVGRRQDAERLIRRLETELGADAYMLAQAYMGIGDRPEVLDLLEQAVARGEPGVADLRVDPVFDPYRDDPRMRRLMERVSGS